MRLVQTKQLEGSGIPYKSAQNICFEGNSFVRGITFSNRLRHLADDIYHAEVEAGNSCLIVEDQTHFTIWHQEPTLEPSPATQAEAAPQLKTVQPFAATEWVQRLQPTLTFETISRQQSPADEAPVMTSKGCRSRWDALQRSGNANQTANQTAESPPIIPKTIRRQPVRVAASARPSAIRSRPNPDQHFSAGAADPWNSDYLDSLSVSTPSRARNAPNYSAANEVDSNLTKVWISLSKPG